MIGFHSRVAEVVTVDFRLFKLTKPIQFTDEDGTEYLLPKAAPSDLASAPQEVWSLIPPFGEYALEAYLHDGGYQNWLQKWDGTQWVKANLTKLECDNLFQRAMEMNLNISEAHQVELYKAVVLAGQHAFKEDRS